MRFEHAQKHRLQAVVRMLQEGLSRLIGQNAARLQQNHSAAQRLRLFEVMGGQHDGVALFVQTTNKRPEALP